MTNKKIENDVLDELIETVQQISLLIEDNNQNIKDCHRTLKKIQDKICPKPVSLSRRVYLLVKQIINRRLCN